MTTKLCFVRYSDVGITSGLRHEDKEQVGGGGEAPGARSAAAASGARADRGRGHGQGAAPDGISVAHYTRIARLGCPSRHEQGRTSCAAGSRGADPLAGSLARRSHGPRLWHAAVDAQAGAAVHRATVRGSIQRGSCLAPARTIGVLQPEAGTACAGAQ